MGNSSCEQTVGLVAGELISGRNPRVEAVVPRPIHAANPSPEGNKLEEQSPVVNAEASKS